MSSIHWLRSKWTVNGRMSAVLTLVLAAHGLIVGGCRTARPQAESGIVEDSSASSGTTEPTAASKEQPDSEATSPGQGEQAVTVAPEHPDHWLSIKKAVDAGTGFWGKGDFDAERNKISVMTKNVAEFTIDTDRIPIDWDRLIVISIDGINAELRPRDYSPLLFRREGYSSWTVVEP